jgi:hypothetical protein
MKLIQIFLLILASSAHGESDPRVAAALNADPDEIQVLLDAMQTRETPAIMPRAAINAQRTDVIELCFRSPRTPNLWLYTAEAVAEMPDSIYQDQLTLMMLKSDSPFWPYKHEIPARDYSGPGMQLYFKPPFTDLFSKYLPDRKLTWEVIKTIASRREIAAEVEAAMNKAAKDEPHAQHPPKYADPAAPTTPPGTAAKTQTDAASEMPIPTTHELDSQSSHRPSTARPEP